jgi:phage protein U
MFNDLINSASRQVYAACETVRRLDVMVTRIDLLSAQMTAGDLRRLGDTLGTLDIRGASSMAKSAALFVSAGDALVNGVTSGIDAGSAIRAVSAATSAINRIGARIPTIVQNALGIFRTAEQAPRIGEQVQAAIPAVESAVTRVSQSMATMFGGPSAEPVIELTAMKAVDIDDAPTAMFVNAHLLIMSTMDTPSERYFFNISTAAHDNLRRQTSYNVARQDRLTRLPALQAVAKGEDTISVSGVIMTKKSGASQMNRLREIGFKMVPVLLTTGYGEAFGQFYISRIEEDQDGMFPDGMPRRQSFTLEFQRYGEDYSNV